MTVEGRSSDRIRSVLGTTIATQVEMTGGAVLKPSMHLVWRHEFHNNGLEATSTFTGGGAAFTSPGQALARNTINIGGSLIYMKSKTFSVSVQLDGERASNYSGLAGQIVGQWRF